MFCIKNVQNVNYLWNIQNLLRLKIQPIKKLLTVMSVEIKKETMLNVDFITEIMERIRKLYILKKIEREYINKENRKEIIALSIIPI
jgi:hypothetical protein